MLYLRWDPAHNNLHWVSLDLTLSTHPWGLKPCQQHQQFPLKHYSDPILLYFSAPKSLSNMASLLARYCLTKYLLLTSDCFKNWLRVFFQVSCSGTPFHRSRPGNSDSGQDPTSFICRMFAKEKIRIRECDTVTHLTQWLFIATFFPITRTQSW